MSDLASVRSSRISGSNASGGFVNRSKPSSKVSNSQVSRISQQSVANTKLSHLTEFLGDLFVVDEYGFTDYYCRKCNQKLHFDEIMAFCLPPEGELVSQSEIKQKVAGLDVTGITCLDCYATEIKLRAEKHRSPVLPPLQQASKNRAGSVDRKTSSRAYQPNRGRKVPNSPKRALFAAKPNSPMAAYKRNRRTSSVGGSSIDSYMAIQMEKRFNRKKDDLVNYANALFSTGTYA